ncbi:MAG: hypothetical protein LUD27_04605 [Clostridia bacterium]|nr:hypothetical protein [Clostridia bacterium]
MKYIRRAIVIMLAAVFVAAAAIGVSVIFAVRNINVAVISYSSSAGESQNFSDSVSKVKTQLSSLTGSNLLGVDEDDISSLIPEDGYARFVSAEKVYPCTVNVTVEERVEAFAVLSEDGSYLVYDYNGEYIATKTENINNLDSCPNVLVSADGFMAEAVEIASLFKEEFSALRSVVETLNVVKSESGVIAEFGLYCGTTLRLVGLGEYDTQKLSALHAAFNSLSDCDKAEGTLSCYTNSNGQAYVFMPDGSLYR